MTPAWSRLLAKVMNSAAMLDESRSFQRAFLRAALTVESRDQLPADWRAFVERALASGLA
jgi:hypothetical protein